MKRILVLLIALASTHVSGGEGQPASSAPAESVPNVVDDDFPLFDEADFIEVYDPLEPVNRAMFWFNDKMYFLVLKPVARGWRYIPSPVRISLRNFFNNLKSPVRIVNAGLQGKFAAAGTEITRFATNTTLGIGGLFDPSKEHFGQQPHNEDAGQTLGFYHVGPGPYLVLPFMGPSNLRDGIGKFGDTYLNLAWYLWGDHKNDDNHDYLGARTTDVVNELSLDKDTYEGIKRDALDPYLFVRDAYAQLRRVQIKK